MKKTLQFQSQLPLLPLPELEVTLKTYLETVRPFLGINDFEKTERAVQEFLNGMGPVLQERLLKRGKKASEVSWEYQPETCRIGHVQAESVSQPAAHVSAIEPGKNSWLIDWWNAVSYLRYRDPVVINVSFFFVLPEPALPVGELMTAQKRGAQLIHHSMVFKQLWDSGEMEAETYRNTPFCMNQYFFMFNSCRIPCPTADRVRCYDPMYSHVVVIRNDVFYVVPTTDAKGRLLSIPELELRLKWIIDQESECTPTPVGVLTADDRDTWTKNYQTIRKLNTKSLDILESSALILCMDDTHPVQPVTREEIAHDCWHHRGYNRWFDKSVQWIVFEDGRAGMIGEHSMMDATTPTKLCDYVCQQIFSNPPAKHPEEYPVIGNAELFSKDPNQLSLGVLPFQMPTECSERVVKILDNLHQIIETHDVQVLKYTRYGKGRIKEFGMSPDSYVQMAIQLAYFKLMGTWAATYESAGMRRFAWGRTETCRSVSTESVAFVKAMHDPSATLDEKAKLCRKAVQAHSKYMHKCLQGNGVDRHLLGLRLCILPNESVPAIFIDPAYTLSCHWTLSTSQIPTDYFEGYGWGEVVPDGYGIAYMVKEESLHFNIAGLIGDASQDENHPQIDVNEGDNRRQYKWQRVKWMKSFIESALDDMTNLFEVCPAEKEEEEIPPSKSVTAQASPVDEQAITVATQTTPPYAKSIDARSTDLGFSLPYYSTASRSYLSGVVGEDLGHVEFEWGEVQSHRTLSRRRTAERKPSSESVQSESYQRGRKWIKMLKEWSIWQQAHDSAGELHSPSEASSSKKP